MSDSPYAKIVRAIEQTTGEPVSSSGKALCPAHDDRQPSLSVSEVPDGTVLFNCHAGCSFSEIMAALGLDEREAFPQSVSNGQSEIVATYPYCVFRRCRPPSTIEVGHPERLKTAARRRGATLAELGSEVAGLMQV